MNVRKIKILHRKSWFGRLVRLPFRLIPSSAMLPVISGPLRGKKWIKGSHNISVILGTYERVQSLQFLKSARNVKVFWDLGAHVGYYSMLFRQANPAGTISAFEPVTKNCVLFEKHMTSNKVMNFTLFQKGVSDHAGTLSFDSGRTTVAGRISESGNTSVEVVTLSDYIKLGLIEIPQLIKMDIEGEEYKVLTNIKEVLQQHKPQIFLSTHGNEVHQKCLIFLRELNYSLTPLDSDDINSCGELLAY